MTAEPRTPAEVDGAVFRGELPAFAAELFGGTHVYQLGVVLFIVPDPARYPAAARPGLELRSAALLLGRCPECRGLRPALAAPAGTAVGIFTRDPHEPACPASEQEIARALDTSDHTNGRHDGRN